MRASVSVYSFVSLSIRPTQIPNMGNNVSYLFFNFVRLFTGCGVLERYP